MRVVAIDQGTTSTRALVLDQTGAGKIVCTREHRQIHPSPGWVEHDPEELLRHVTECLEAAGPVDAIGIDNQGESCLAWDGKTGRAISPVIVWQDRRTGQTIDDLKADGAEELTLAKAGLPLDPYFSASKLAWILDNVPAARDLLAKGQLRLGTTDAFALAITGERIPRAPKTGLLPTLAWQSAGENPTYALEGGVYCAGSAINWVKSLGLLRHSTRLTRLLRHPPSAGTLHSCPR